MAAGEDIVLPGCVKFCAVGNCRPVGALASTSAFRAGGVPPRGPKVYPTRFGRVSRGNVSQSDVSNPSSGLESMSHHARVLTRGTGAVIALAHKGSMICRASVGNAPTLGARLDISAGLSATLTSVPLSKLLLELEPAWQVFVGNLNDLLFPPRMAPLKLTSRPAPFWPDVLVPSEPAWEGFYQSLMLHVTLVAMLGLVHFGYSQRPLLRQSRLTANKSDTVYYLPPEYLRALRGESKPSPETERSAVKPQVLAVRRESRRHTQKSITPPTLHLKDSRFRITAWNPIAPTVPFSATRRSPTSAPATSAAAIAPPPDTSAVSRAQRLTLGTPQAIAPAPLVGPSVSQPVSISFGHQNVVAPAPVIPGDAQRSLAGSAQASLTRGATPVVPPPPSVGGSTRQTASISLGHLNVVRPVPEIPVTAQRSLASSAQVSLTRGATQVVPPPPLLQIAGSYLIDTPDGGAILVVPPPPSVGGLERRSGHSARSLGGGMQAVVPPAPRLQGAGTAGRGTGNGMATRVVPPPPSVGGLGGSGGQSASSLGAGGMQAVPPPPRVQGAGTAGRGTGNGMAMGVVPPSPSVGSLGASGGRSSSSQGAASMPTAQPKIAVQTAGSDGTQIASASGLPAGGLPGEMAGNGGEAHADSKKAIAANELVATKQLSIYFIGPALAFPQSSYFSNFEVFIAEERIGRHQSRVIKLVYDFLPYQPRLSDLGPGYPALDNLRAIRDPSCDEPLKEVVSFATSLHWPKASLAQLNTTSSKQRQTVLPCYQTTADDYRKALEHHR